MGCYGNKDVRTPHIDGLSLSGMTFDHHYDTTAICMVSRVNVMTGLYEYRHGCNFDHGPLTEKLWKTSYPIRLRQAGYLTAFAGKFGFEVRKGTQKDGSFLPEEDFDKWGGGPGQTNYATAKNPSMKAYAKKYPHSSRSYGAFGRDFVKESAKTGKPFCLSISFKGAAQTRSTGSSVRQGLRRQKIHQTGQLRTRVRETLFSAKQARSPVRALHKLGLSRQIRRSDGGLPPDGSRGGCSGRHDPGGCGGSGRGKNTVFIFTSDNGFFCGSHGYGSKVLPYEESTNAPMIIYDPRHPSSGKKLRSAALTANIDERHDP